MKLIHDGKPVMSLIKFLFWFWFPDPKIGDRYVSYSNYGDPWNSFYYEVIDVKEDWIKLRTPGAEHSMKKCVLIGCYRKINL